MKAFTNLKPLFILGLPRSGTTLTQSLLDGHPQLLTDMGDSRFFKWYRLARGKPFAEQVHLAERHLLHMWRPEGAYYQHLLGHIPHEAVFHHFRELLDQSDKEPKDFLESYILAIGLAEGSLDDDTHYWVEKTPRNEYYLAKLVDWWPDAHFIHVIRDPRDVMASYKMRAIKNERPVPAVGALAFAWGKSVRQGIKYEERLGSNRYLFVRYEDLVSHLEQQLQRVTSFLNIRDEPSLRKPTKGHGEIPWGGNAATGTKRFRVHQKRTKKWESELSDAEVRALEALLRKEMAGMDYTPANNIEWLKPGLTATIGQFLRELQFRVRYR
jgi:hypothetical protein